ncbi:protein Lines homolog 1-like [Tubulanus polymorphus]|uniref:protein Lines homolog 1-like n=1 Tax=Tubulanus polymorphus TaxID=672921 RepID=UPI003DA409F7
MNEDQLREVYNDISEGRINDENLRFLKTVCSKSVEGILVNRKFSLLFLTTLMEVFESESTLVQGFISAPEVLTFLVTELENSDKFISYSACKALVCLCQILSEKDQISRVVTTVCQFTAQSTTTSIQIQLDLAVKFLSSDFKNEVFQKGFIDVLVTNWNRVVNSSLLDQTISNSYTRLIFMKLWMKACKTGFKIEAHLKTTVKNNEADSCESVNSCFIDLVRFPYKRRETLLNILLTSDDRMLCFNVMNVLLLYFDIAAKSYVESDHDRDYLDLSSKVVEICNDEERGFMDLPYHSGFIGFGGSQCSRDTEWKPDSQLLRKVCLLVLRSSQLQLTKSVSGDSSLVSKCLNRLEMLLKTKVRNDEDFQTNLLRVFADQDNALIDCMLILLDLHIKITTARPDELKHLNPHGIFIKFLKIILYDQSVLLDFVTSPETSFLEYLVRYLRYAITDWYNFVDFHKTCKKTNSSDTEIHSSENNPNSHKTDDSSESDDESFNLVKRVCRDRDFDPSSLKCEDDSNKAQETESSVLNGVQSESVSNLLHLEAYESSSSDDDEEIVKHPADDTMTCLIRLRMKLGNLNSHDLVPFNVKPLIKLIEKCEHLYEQ